MSNQVAKTILSQIGGGRAMMMIGGKDLVGSETALLFGWKAKAKNKANKVKIELNGADLYDITFYRVWGTKLTEISTFKDYYCDMLVSCFEEETGLYLKF